MKKTYQAPKTELIKLASELMLNVASTEAAAGVSAGSREGDSSFFDDDED